MNCIFSCVLTDLDRILSLGDDNVVEFEKKQDPPSDEQQWTKAYDFSDGKYTANVYRQTANKNWPFFDAITFWKDSFYTSFCEFCPSGQNHLCKT